MKRESLIRLLVVAALGMLLTGCMKARPQYQPPALPKLEQNSSWSAPLAGGVVASPVADASLAQWWMVLKDPLLSSLEERAVKGNLDLRKAEAAIRKARAQRNVIEEGRLPSLTVGAAVSGNRSDGSNSQSYSADLDASWEPDFYHRVRQSIEAYQADLEASQEDLRNTLVSLASELALDYINVRSYQAQLDITRSNLASQEETYQLTLAQYESGLATELDAAQARTTVESTRAAIPTLETNLQQSMNNIALLLGERPGVIDAELAEIKPIPVIPVQVAVGVPADLLRRRPDVRSAERQVAAQAARVGVANADLYPAFALSGSFGLGATHISDLFSADGIISSIAGSVQQTIFSRRKIHEQIKVQDAALDQLVASYESTVLAAIKDVEDALQSFAKEQVRRKSLAEAESAAERSAYLSRELYISGLKDYTTVLETQRSLLTLQNQLAQSDATITGNLAKLYKALGGGWNLTAGSENPAGGAVGAASQAATTAAATQTSAEKQHGKEKP